MRQEVTMSHIYWSSEINKVVKFFNSRIRKCTDISISSIEQLKGS